MDPSSITQQLAKQADTGTAAIILLLLVLFVLCWPRIVDGIERLRGRKTTIDNDPINVNKLDKYVSRGEFNQRMERVDRDVAGLRNDVSMLRSDITNSNRAVIDKLDEIDKRSEDRAIALNRRIDPIIEKVAANSEAVDFIKKAAINSTVGGKK